MQAHCKSTNKELPYKGIVHNVLNDAPFIGAVIIANSCSMPCTSCINEHLKQETPTLHDTAETIIDKVKANGLDEGVILSGLEWTEQPDDLVELVEAALQKSLKVIVYTHHQEGDFFKIVPSLRHKPIYVKFGLYDSALISEQHFSHTVKLATTNQTIKYFGKPPN